PDGSRCPVEVHPANFEYEAQPCVVAVARDMSGRAEAELRYRELMAVVDKGILVRDASGTVVYANAAAMRMLDVDPTLGVAESLRPSRWKVIDEDGEELSEQGRARVGAQRQGKAEGNEVLGFYHLGLRKLAWFAVTSVPQYAPGADRPHQVLSLCTDVTKLKRGSALFAR